MSHFGNEGILTAHITVRCHNHMVRGCRNEGEVISVGAVTNMNDREAFSSTGSSIDLVAPGVDILSTTKDRQYDTLSGTSMATSHVTGAAALLWSKNKKMTNEMIKNKLYETAPPLGNSHVYGHDLNCICAN